MDGLSAYRRTALLVVGVVSICLGGCLPSISDGPDRLIPLDQEAASIGTVVGMPDMTRDDEVYRDHYITARMYTIDLEYYKYEADLTHERQDLSFAADFVNIGLAGAVPLVSAKATKDILGAAASGLTGVKSSYSDDILLNRTIQVLQTQMRANRAAVAANILSNLKKPVAQYPLPIALSELEDYYRAGTISGALLAVNANVSQDAVDKQILKDAVVQNSVGMPIGSADAPLNAPRMPTPFNNNGGLNLLEREQPPVAVTEIQETLCLANRSGRFDPPTRDAMRRFFEGAHRPAPDLMTRGLTLNGLNLLRKAVTTVNLIEHQSKKHSCSIPGLNTPEKLARLIQPSGSQLSVSSQDATDSRLDERALRRGGRR